MIVPVPAFRVTKSLESPPSRSTVTTPLFSQSSSTSTQEEDTDTDTFEVTAQHQLNQSSQTPSLSFPSSLSSSRREWFQGVITHMVTSTAALGLGTSGALLPPTVALAASSESVSSNTQLLTPPTASAATSGNNNNRVVISESVCDPTVTVWRKSGNDRLLYLLGTAHISQVSAVLAGSLVHDVHPNAVFVELDLKRVGRIDDGKIGVPSETAADSSTSPSLAAAAEGTSTSIPASAATTTDSKLAPAAPVIQVVVSPPPAPLVGSSWTNPNTDGSQQQPALAPSKPGANWFQRGALNFAATAVGNAVKSMYSNLSTAGFNPGEEFATAIRAGQDVGAAIVLGDQDVEVTLRRLTQALAATDLSKLLNPDASFEKSMAELMPPVQQQIPQQQKNNNNDNTNNTAEEQAKFKEELSAYVERLKSRDSVRKIMAELDTVAPALVQVMLTERDAYMATGLDTLNQFEVIVAVMGIAHQDGVEHNLTDKGWSQVRLTACPTKTL